MGLLGLFNLKSFNREVTAVPSSSPLPRARGVGGLPIFSLGPLFTTSGLLSAANSATASPLSVALSLADTHSTHSLRQGGSDAALVAP